MSETTQLTATLARKYAKQIAEQCSECFERVKAVKSFGQWVITINGGEQACYGKTIKTEEGANDLIRVFANEPARIA